MPEPTSTTTAAGLAGALAVVAEATGLQVPLMIWAAIGGYWAFRFLDPMTFLGRMSALALAALLGAIGAPAAAAVAVAACKHFLPWWPLAADAAMLAKPISATIGFLLHPVIGKKLIEISNRKADEVAK